MWNRRNAVIATLALFAIAGIVFAIIAQSAANTKTRQLATAESMASQTVSALNSAQATAESVASQTVSALNSAQATTERDLTEAQFQYATAEAAQVKLSTQVADLSSQLRSEKGKVSSLEAANNCVSTPASIDYAGNAAVSDSLKAWLEDTQGKIDKVSWDVVWVNSKTSIHKLTGKYQFVFVVYFDEADHGYRRSIYDISNSCWLDR